MRHKDVLGVIEQLEEIDRRLHWTAGGLQTTNMLRSREIGDTRRLLAGLLSSLRIEAARATYKTEVGGG